MPLTSSSTLSFERNPVPSVLSQATVRLCKSILGLFGSSYLVVLVLDDHSYHTIFKHGRLSN